MEYLVFLKHNFTMSILMSIYIWKKKGFDKIVRPIELEDGNFAIPKPLDFFIDGLEFDEIRTEIIPKNF